MHIIHNNILKFMFIIIKQWDKYLFLCLFLTTGINKTYYNING